MQDFPDAYAQTVTYAMLLAGIDGVMPDELMAEALHLAMQYEELEQPIQEIKQFLAAHESDADDNTWYYFYEEFLAAYIPHARRRAGVYFTPQEIVKAQVSLTQDLLRNRFQKSSFADHGVSVVDPAVGTGAYLLEVIESSAGQAADDLARNLHGFEVLFAPYAISRLRLGQRLRDMGSTAP